jgi:hypothetical protein
VFKNGSFNPSMKHDRAAKSDDRQQSDQAAAESATKIEPCTAADQSYQKDDQPNAAVLPTRLVQDSQPAVKPGDLPLENMLTAGSLDITRLGGGFDFRHFNHIQSIPLKSCRTFYLKLVAIAKYDFLLS